jgi:membrane-associated phospholipid phosphatase
MKAKPLKSPHQRHAPEDGVPGAWKRLALGVSRIRPLAWAAGLTVGLAVFLVLLPVTMRVAIWYGLQAQRTLTSMLLVFSLLAISLVWSAGQRLDAWAFLWLNVRGSRPPWLDGIMLGFTQIGNTVVALAMALLFFLSGDRFFAYELVFGTLTLWLVVELLKAVVHRSRPFIRLTQTRIVGYRVGGRSFPSGHTSQAFFIATLMAQHSRVSAGLVPLLYALALLVGITRMYVGAHYPRDVLAGIILGSVWGLLGGLVESYVRGGVG